MLKPLTEMYHDYCIVMHDQCYLMYDNNECVNFMFEKKKRLEVKWKKIKKAILNCKLCLTYDTNLCILEKIGHH